MGSIIQATWETQEMRFLASSATVWASLLAPAVVFAQATRPDSDLAKQYQPTIKPLLKKYCYSCHSGKRIEAEIDLTKFEQVSSIARHPKVWQKLREMLDTAQMPPKEAKQPTADERKQLRQWVRGYLTKLAESNAGDPGRVVLRRLSNSEYTYTLRDLTGIKTLSPAKEFPIGGAAGEGFTNTGDAMVMSPSLVRKYLDAAKEVAAHAVLLPDGIRFSARKTRRDWTDESLGKIRAFYSKFVNVQNGRVDLVRYLQATLRERAALRSGAKSAEQVAREYKLNAQYLQQLWTALSGSSQSKSFLLDQVREQWNDAAPGDAAALARFIQSWQTKVWTFKTIGHIGRAGGPKAWMEPIGMTASEQQFSIALPQPSGPQVTVYLGAGDLGDGAADDVAIFENARLVAANKPPISLRHVQSLHKRLVEIKQEMVANAPRYLAAAAEATPKTDAQEQAAKHGLQADAMRTWLDYLGLDVGGAVKVQGHFVKKVQKSGNYDFVKGWGTHQTPLITANSSAQQVRIPGIARPHSFMVHPSPTLFVAVGWQSPIDGVVRIEGRIQDAHPECGNGVEWIVRHQTGFRTNDLWKGEFGMRGKATMPAKSLRVRRGELVSFIVGPRQRSHACDLTELNLTISEVSGKKRTWDLAKDVSPDIHAGNPHADRLGNAAVWHFYRGEMTSLAKPAAQQVSIPTGSTLAKWLGTKDADKRAALVARLQGLLSGKIKAAADSPDAIMLTQILGMQLSYDANRIMRQLKSDPRFGKHPTGGKVAESDLVVRAPHVEKFVIPATLAKGRKLVVKGRLDSTQAADGSVQLFADVKEPILSELSISNPLLVNRGSKAAKRVESGLEAFRNLFPAALCYTRIVPVDEVVTLTLYYREDHHLRRLMLNAAQRKELDRLWDELIFISQEPYKRVVALEQIREFATQDRPDMVVALRVLIEPTKKRASEFTKRLASLEPIHLQKVIDFADRAWRRKLTEPEKQTLSVLYKRIRDQGLAHDQTIRLLLARVLTAPAFLYRLEQPGAGSRAIAISNDELANRLSYFLWSSMPDVELRKTAEAGQLTSPRQLIQQTRRMLKDDRTRRLAIEFACQWLHVRDYDQNNEKNEKLYPQFAALRSAMYEETVQFFEDLFRRDGSVLDILNADHTFLNEPLARHYGVKGVTGAEFRRVQGMRGRGRGGILGMATILASQSGASRTSPILRGNWVSETLLGERLPKPPANVPVLPEQVPAGLTTRQLIQKHTSVKACAKCHARIDPYGFALEQFDAIGRLRRKPMDTKTTLIDGKTIDGIDGLRGYLARDRQEEFLQQFCRKLLGYALGRSVQLSDEPLLVKMQQDLKNNGFRFSVAIESIVASPQFQRIRGKQEKDDG